MKREEYTKRVNEMCAYIDGHAYDNMANELKERKITNPLTYGAWCERNFELNLRDDYKRMTTCTSDLSIAEWCVPIEGMTAISSTLRNMVQFWRDNIELMAEFIIVLNMKAWEHHARKNANYADMYSELYLMMKDLFFDWFDESNPNHNEAVRYYYDYVD